MVLNSATLDISAVYVTQHKSVTADILYTLWVFAVIASFGWLMGRHRAWKSLPQSSLCKDLLSLLVEIEMWSWILFLLHSSQVLWWKPVESPVGTCWMVILTLSLSSTTDLLLMQLMSALQHQQIAIATRIITYVCPVFTDIILARLCGTVFHMD